MLTKHYFTLLMTLSMASTASATCFSLFQPSSTKTMIIEQLFTSLELNRANQIATRKYSVFDLLRIRRDLDSHLFIRTQLTLPSAFIIPQAHKTSLLKLDFEIPTDVQPLRAYIHQPNVKSKFDLALNLIIRQVEQLGYPWSVKLARNYLSSRNIPKTKIISRSEAKREIFYNNNIILFVENSETKISQEIHFTLDSFLYSPSTGQLIFAVLY